MTGPAMRLRTHVFEPGAKCPLDGIRVLDLSRLVAGNMLSLQLADFGAEVIKVEDPGVGDTLRHWKEFGDDHPEGVSAYWKVYARNKKSLTLNLRSAEGLDLLRRLVRHADVFIESFRPGTLENMGLGPDDLLALNPKIVVVRISGWGQTGPYRDHPGFGSLVEAISGFAAKNGSPGQPPTLPNMALADMVAGLYGAFAVTVALRSAQAEGGTGQIVDLSLLEPLLSILGPDAAVYGVTGQVPARNGNRISITAPRNVYRTGDGGYLALSGSIQKMVERIFHAIDRPELITDPRFLDNASRLANVDALDAIIQEFVARLTLDEALAHFRRLQVTVGPVYDVAQVIEDEHIVQREVLVQTPDQQLGMLATHNVVPRLSKDPGKIRYPAPRLGEHTAEVLAAVGVDEAALAGLRARGIA
jgi:crotonobetainyl-CoA:carnitine CoA-transferase CaiB-like acyl-CoA transferase